MNPAVNAWKEIERWLKLRGRTQSDLAARLGVSASAVTQIKKGINQLSMEQLRAVIEYLEIDEVSAEDICCRILRARLGRALPHRAMELRIVEGNVPRNRWPAECRSGMSRTVPRISARKLYWYEPALESAQEFIYRNSDGTAQTAGRGDFLLTDLSPSAEPLALLYSRPVRSHEPVFAKLRSGMMVRGFFCCGQGKAELHLASPLGEVLRWKRGVDVNFFFWAFPVCDMTAQNPK